MKIKHSKHAEYEREVAQADYQAAAHALSQAIGEFLAAAGRLIVASRPSSPQIRKLLKAKGGLADHFGKRELEIQHT